ncbi:uncharacterized protein LOC108602045 isoform X2 [Drosophila busckii]|nr:uncharacterized protein LOC108602045 isoform X2 [Drosophila busckii]
MSARLRIFRKRKNTWWRIASTITLNSLLGTIFSENLTALLTAYEDILHSPNTNLTNKLKVIDPSKNLNDLQAYKNTILQFLNHKSKNVLNPKPNVDTGKLRQPRKEAMTNIQQKHTASNFLAKCPNSNRLCFNVLGDRLPAFNIKIKVPFRENAAHQTTSNVLLSRIITDASTKDALQIFAEIINKGHKARSFSINISNCPLTGSPSLITTVRKVLYPNIGETITFLLPFIMGTKRNIKFSCEVVVKANIETNIQEMKSNKAKRLKSSLLVVSKRSIDIETHSRCFCIWRCHCQCIGKIETHISSKVCKKMSFSSIKRAGLLMHCPANEESNELCLLDTCSESKNYQVDFIWEIIEVALIITCLFILLLCCCKCFTPRNEDLLVASTEWKCLPKVRKCLNKYNTEIIPKYNPKKNTPNESSQSLYVFTDMNSKQYPKNVGNLDSPSGPSCYPICSSSVNQIDLLELALVSLRKQKQKLRNQAFKK